MIGLWLLFTLAVIAIHLYLINGKKKSPNKVAWFIIRFVVGTVFVLMEYRDASKPLGVVILAYIFTAWFPHDTILSQWLYGKPWGLNKTGPIDRLQGSGSPYIWIMKAIAFFTLLAMYFFNK